MLKKKKNGNLRFPLRKYNDMSFYVISPHIAYITISLPVHPHHITICFCIQIVSSFFIFFKKAEKHNYVTAFIGGDEIIFFKFFFKHKSGDFICCVFFVLSSCYSYHTHTANIPWGNE